MDSFTIFTWTLTACTIAGTYLNSKQNKYGFLVWGLCNMLWLGVDFTRGIYAQAALYVVFIGFNIYGWQQWGKNDNLKMCAGLMNIDNLVVRKRLIDGIIANKLSFKDQKIVIHILKTVGKYK